MPTELDNITLDKVKTWAVAQGLKDSLESQTVYADQLEHLVKAVDGVRTPHTGKQFLNKAMGVKFKYSKERIDGTNPPQPSNLKPAPATPAPAKRQYIRDGIGRVNEIVLVDSGGRSDIWELKDLRG